MVHQIPDGNGEVHTHIDTSRSGYFIANFDIDNNVVVTPQGGGTIDLTLVPGAKVHMSDKIGVKAVGANSTRNYAFFMWSAGEAA